MTLPRVQRVAAYGVCVGRDARLLLCRLSERTQAAGAWTLPGGGVEHGEHPEAALRRELAEETGLTGTVRELLTVDSVTGPLADPDGATVDVHRIRLLYRVTITGGSLRDETGGSTDAARWFTRDETAGLRLVPVGDLGVRLAFGGD